MISRNHCWHFGSGFSHNFNLSTATCIIAQINVGPKLTFRLITSSKLYSLTSLCYIITFDVLVGKYYLVCVKLQGWGNLPFFHAEDFQFLPLSHHLSLESTFPILHPYFKKQTQPQSFLSAFCVLSVSLLLEATLVTLFRANLVSLFS